MEVIKTYVACDGKKFEDEWECQEYEEALEATKYQDTALLFDLGGKPLPLSQEGFQGAFIVKAVTDEAAQYMAEAFHDYWNPWSRDCRWTPSEAKAGCWIFIDNNDDWVPASEYLKTADILRKIV